jgi:hypothetical protein
MSILTTCISPASFWAPRELPSSAWLRHAPFAFWLVDALRPNVLVELGTWRGFSYLVFCQAVSQAGLSTRCHAVDTWRGDEHTGFYGDEVFESVRRLHDRRYSDFSRLIRATFDDALAEFADGSIDLLHIDGRHLYEDVRHDFESWQPKLSSRAVVLFHDTQVKERDFGVFRFWDEIKRQYPHFEFIAGFGLGVLGYGPDLPDNLKTFFAAAQDETANKIIRHTYSCLGNGIVNRREALRLDGMLKTAQGRIAELEKQLAERKGEILPPK